MIDGHPEKKLIEEKIMKTKTAAAMEKIEKIEEISYNKKSIPLKSDRLKQVFKKVESHLHSIQEYSESQSFDPTL